MGGLLLYELEGCDELTALHAIPGGAHNRVIAGHRPAGDPPGNAGARLGQAGEGGAQALGIRKEIVNRDATILEAKFRGHKAPHEMVPVDVPRKVRRQS